jgi:hypothetical protein
MISREIPQYIPQLNVLLATACRFRDGHDHRRNLEVDCIMEGCEHQNGGTLDAMYMTALEFPVADTLADEYF